MRGPVVLDLFAGIGGWDVGARSIGIDPIGLELDSAACSVRAAAGLRTIRADVATFPVGHLEAKVCGLIASPPCQDFSHAGTKAGIDGDRGQLMWEVVRYVDALRPCWIACEQVPPALEWWKRFARQFADEGYECWTGILNAADYGVPQTRRRAFLLAVRDDYGWTPGPPPRTHHRNPGLFDGPDRWVTMAEALAEHWPEQESWMVNRRADYRNGAPTIALIDGAARPAPTVTAMQRWITGPNDRRLSVRDGLVLQGFPDDYPVALPIVGDAWRCVGNAVPPPLAAAVLSALLQEVTE